MSSSMLACPEDIISKAAHVESYSNEANNLKIEMTMLPGGNKLNKIRVMGMKIFLKPQTFVLLHNFRTNAYPIYKMDSRDKPNGFNADPEQAN